MAETSRYSRTFLLACAAGGLVTGVMLYRHMTNQRLVDPSSFADTLLSRSVTLDGVLLEADRLRVNGNTHVARREYDAALTAYHAAVEVLSVFPDNVSCIKTLTLIQVNTAQVYLSQGRALGTIRLCDELLARPRDVLVDDLRVKTLFRKARGHLLKDEKDHARVALQEADTIAKGENKVVREELARL